MATQSLPMAATLQHGRTARLILTRHGMHQQARLNAAGEQILIGCRRNRPTTHLAEKRTSSLFKALPLPLSARLSPAASGATGGRECPGQ